MSVWAHRDWRISIDQELQEPIESDSGISLSAQSNRVQRLTAVYDAVRVQVLHRAHDGPDELGCVLLEEVRLGADPVKQLATLAEISHEID